MTRPLNALLLLTSCVLGLAAWHGPSWAMDGHVEIRAAGPAGEGQPLLGGLCALGFWWLWRLLRRDRQGK